MDEWVREEWVYIVVGVVWGFFMLIGIWTISNAVEATTRAISKVADDVSYVRSQLNDIARQVARL